MRGMGGNLLISAWVSPESGRWAYSDKIRKAGFDAMDHGEDEFFDLVWLDLGFGEELGGAEAKLRHFGLGDLAAGVDDHR